MNVFELRRHQISDYEQYVRSFMSISDNRVRAEVASQLDGNPECGRIFRIKPDDGSESGLHLHRHQGRR
ncbi:MAG TPA: hypothetical protein VFH58_08230 [Acidimicrobiales bacterium]|nr:hypothetical protein [Acidimicrobiales bacterium]